MKNISQKKFEKLWGDGGPYSEAYLTIEARLIDDVVSRYKIVVDAKINPTTFEICEMSKDKFENDKLVKEILENAFWESDEDGYQYVFFSTDYIDEENMKKATKVYEKAQKAVLDMHKFVMEYLEIE